jgi:hypothetical protein
MLRDLSGGRYSLAVDSQRSFAVGIRKPIARAKRILIRLGRHRSLASHTDSPIIGTYSRPRSPKQQHRSDNHQQYNHYNPEIERKVKFIFVRKF